jgi:REP element-mobilizing transposase RayT
MAGVQAANNQGVKSMTKSLSHTKWMCKYHIVFTPKYRRKVIYNQYKASIVEIQVWQSTRLGVGGTM